MSELLQNDAQIEAELAPEPFLLPATGSLFLHLALAGGMLAFGYLGGLFHHNTWGSQDAGGAIQVSLVSSALPLPSEEVNENVLSTEKPSESAAAPTPKATEKVDDDAIALSDKRKKLAEQTAERIAQRAPTQQQDNRAQYGETAGSSTPRSVSQQAVAIGNVSLNQADAGLINAYYVRNINSKMTSNWAKSMVDQRTPKGTRAYIVFSIRKWDGVPTNAKLAQSSGVPSLDQSCLDALHRIDTFSPLPQAYNQATLQVSYYCEY